MTSGAESGVHPSCVRCGSRFPSGPVRAGEVDGLMAEAVVSRSVTILAVPEQVRVARAFVAGVLGDSFTFIEVKDEHEP